MLILTYTESDLTKTGSFCLRKTDTIWFTNKKNSLKIVHNYL